MECNGMKWNGIKNAISKQIDHHILFWYIQSVRQLCKITQNRSIVLAVIDGEFTVKRVNVNDDALYLMPENSNFSPIKITEEMDFQVWGVVTYIIHKAV